MNRVGKRYPRHGTQVSCGDNVRNITGCPVAGLARDELFDTRGLLAEATNFFISHPEYSDLPRKHKITLVNNEYGIKETFSVDIKPDATEKQIKDYSDRLPK